MSIKRFLKPILFIFISLLLHILVITVVMVDLYSLTNYLFDKKYPSAVKSPIVVDVIDLPDYEHSEEKPKKDSMASFKNRTVEGETSPEPSPKPTKTPPPPSEDTMSSKAKEPSKDSTEKNITDKRFDESNIIEEDGKISQPKETVEKTEDKNSPSINLYPSKRRLTELSRQQPNQQQYAKNKTKGKKLSLNTSELKYYKYMANLKRRIELYWEYPKAAARRNQQGKLKIDFTITKDGVIKDIVVKQSSKYPALDDAATLALRLASPFQVFPANFDLEEMDINGNFEYNLLYR